MGQVSHLKNVQLWNIKKKQKLYLHIAATYSLLQMPFKFLTPNPLVHSQQTFDFIYIRWWPTHPERATSHLGDQTALFYPIWKPTTLTSDTALKQQSFKKNFKKMYVHIY